ncbi:MAG: SAM-dependent DNA methyltransferase, partial [Betaproteobacteria bacterium]|nr:SAM-dependent DNA methyltransferase [Betaproteobacteria bacterium]
LLDDGMSYGDYVEQLTYLLFLKMADERARAPYNQQNPIPKKYDWESLLNKDGAELSEHYDKTLKELGKLGGILGLIFGGAQNRFKNPVKLRRIAAELIDKENWSAMAADVKGAAYEGLLEKNAQDTKSGAGQYFTPRPLIEAIVRAAAPKPGETVCDPACGTGGFLLAAHDYVAAENPYMDKRQKKALKEKTFFGCELVNNTARLCAMNLLLHGIGDKEKPPLAVADALTAPAPQNYNVVLTNPPFGVKSGTTITTKSGKTAKQTDIIAREDFWAAGANKQLNFVQHVWTMLKINGRAAVVVPDNVLFEGGMGETVRRRLLLQCDVHTLLRLPTGVFYAQGVKANVLFFDKKPASGLPQTEKLWIYDLRTGMHFTLKNKPMRAEDLADFVRRYNPQNRHVRRQDYDAKKNPQGRWRAFSYEELCARPKLSLDIFWLKDDARRGMENLPAPKILVREMLKDLSAAVGELKKAEAELAKPPGKNRRKKN